MNMANLDIYTSRLLSAFCLFIILSQANVFLDPVNNTLLVLGYRFFILATPVLFHLFSHRLTFIAFALIEMGLMAWLLKYPIAGTILFATGMSVSGYMLKYYSAASTKGAAGNKIALNLGSILSGLALILSFTNKSIFLICALAVLISVITFSRYYQRARIAEQPTNHYHFSLRDTLSRKGIAWALIGFVIGVKLISFVSILPQYLIQANHGELPGWFGWLLITNSLFIVVFQIPVMNRIKKLSKNAALIPLFIGMVIIMLSPYMKLTSFTGCFIWTLLLSLVECGVSYLDTLSQRDEMLLIKEIVVGVGSALTVFLARSYELDMAAMMIGSISVILLIIAVILFLPGKLKMNFPVSQNSLAV